ncbi:MAG TPA: cardiolipin synthase [Candidatus Methanomethylophilaceae archaeon]|nr:cardiolipin synthase [Candidatus Methanomethylophilaceae archaeon]
MFFSIDIPGDFLTGSFTGDLVLFLIPINLVLVFAMMFWERSDPQSTLLWMMVMLFIPALGFILYLFIGQTFYSKYAFRSKAYDDLRFKKAMKGQKIQLKMDQDDLEMEHPGSSNFVNTMASVCHGYTDDNEVELFTDGRLYFKALFEDIRNAKKTINFEFYIIRNDEIGEGLVNLLTRKQEEGVEVRIMCDAFGFGKGPKKAMKRFVDAGGDFTLFHSRAVCLLSPRKNNRNHRKIMVVDGAIGWTGGHNIGNEYFGKGPLGHWRDASVRIVGGAVNSLQLRFLTDWRYATRQDLVLEERFYNNPFGNGKEVVQVISGGPDVIEKSPIHAQYLMLFTRCRKTLYIQTPYLVPDEASLAVLKLAAVSGVDVRIMIPDKPDHIFVYWANLHYANQLMEAGVRVYHYKNGFVHAKTIVADSYYCSVGSSNLDERSMKLNFETNAMIYSHELGGELTDTFMGDLEQCDEYTVEKYKNKNLRESLKVSVCRLASSLL